MIQQASARPPEVVGNVIMGEIGLGVAERTMALEWSVS